MVPTQMVAERFRLCPRLVFGIVQFGIKLELYKILSRRALALVHADVIAGQPERCRNRNPSLDRIPNTKKLERETPSHTIILPPGRQLAGRIQNPFAANL